MEQLFADVIRPWLPVAAAIMAGAVAYFVMSHFA